MTFDENHPSKMSIYQKKKQHIPVQFRRLLENSSTIVYFLF